MLRSTVNENNWSACVAEFGGVAEATQKIMNELGCSFSKADKLARCKYKRSLPLTEQKALAKLFKRKMADLFSLAGTKEIRAAS